MITLIMLPLINCYLDAAKSYYCKALQSGDDWDWFITRSSCLMDEIEYNLKIETRL